MSPKAGASNVTGSYTLYGLLGSPYTVKMRAVLRYRRLSYRFVSAFGGMGPLAKVRPALVPVLAAPTAPDEPDAPDAVDSPEAAGRRYWVDSTTMIDVLEQRHPDVRSLLPPDPAQAFVAYLLEDFADEWLTKVMFHYRWRDEAQALETARQGAFDVLGPVGVGRLEAVAQGFTQRQLKRRGLVGATEENAPLLESTFRAVMGLLDGHVTESLFLFGARPSRADFGLYGQLKQLASDAASAALMRRGSPYAHRWVTLVDDLCGVEGEWASPKDELPEAVRGLLRLCASVYLPFLLANAAAVERGHPEVKVTLDGHSYQQPVYRYQAKCLQALRAKLASVDGPARERLRGWLDPSGLWGLVADLGR